MTTEVPKHLVDNRLAEALGGFGLKPSVESDYSYDVELFIKVHVGGDNVALVTEPFDCSDDRVRVVKIAGHLLERKDVECAVAVCYSGRVPHESTEETRYAWRIIRKPEQDSEWMSGGIAELAFSIALSPGGPREPGDTARALVDNLVECNAGPLVAALPFSSATSRTFEGLRRVVAEVFYIEVIIASHDSERVGFSVDGEKPEVLLVCKPRAAVGEGSSVTRVVNLARNPSSAEEAQSVASHIEGRIRAGKEPKRESGSVYQVEGTELCEGDWGAVRLFSPFLREQFLQLTRGCIFPKTFLGKIADIGPTGRSVRDAFLRRRLAPDLQEYGAFWGHDNESTRTMRVEADSSVWPHPGKEKRARRYWGRRSNLLLPYQPNLSSVRLMAVRLDEPSLGSMWTNCTIRSGCGESEQLEKALCVYLNSTVGILAMLGGLSRGDKLVRRRAAEHEWETLAVPDFANCDYALEALVTAFDESGDLELLPLPQSKGCPVRNAIDAVVCEALGIGSELVQSIRRLIVAEPSVKGESGKRRESSHAGGQQLSLLCYIDLNK